MQDLKVSLIQVDQCWEDVSANLTKFESLIQKQSDTDLIVLPEMFHTSFSMNTSLAKDWEDNPIVEKLKQWSLKSQAAIYSSLMVKEQHQFYNRGVFVSPNGSVQYYDKRKSFGLGGEDRVFSQGDQEVIVDYKGWKINLQICYDLRFPELIRNRINSDGNPSYDVLIYVANWPQKRVLHWSTLLQARAIENQCFVVGVNRIGTDGNNLVYSGASAIYDGLGETKLLMNDQENTSTVTLSYESMQNWRLNLPFLKDRK
jgi:predicted amidohydrolase